MENESKKVKTNNKFQWIIKDDRQSFMATFSKIIFMQGWEKLSRF